MGDATPQKVVEMFNKGTRFEIYLLEHEDSSGVWTLGDMKWTGAIFTSVRGTGMAPDDIPIITATAKALTLTHTGTDGVEAEYGHHL